MAELNNDSPCINVNFKRRYDLTRPSQASPTQAFTSRDINLSVDVNRIALRSSETSSGWLSTIHPCNQPANTRIIARPANWCPVNQAVPLYQNRSGWTIDPADGVDWLHRVSVKRKRDARSITDKGAGLIDKSGYRVCSLILHNSQGEPNGRIVRERRTAREKCRLATGLITSSIRGTRMHHELRIVFAPCNYRPSDLP